MGKLLRNLLIGGAVAFTISFVFAFLGARLHADEVGSSGRTLGGALGIICFFILHLRGGNRRVAAADPEARARALSFTCPADRALVYFIRTGFMGKAVGVDIDVDGRVVAQIKSPRFTCIELAPGSHEMKASVPGGSALGAEAAQRVGTLAGGSVTVLHIGMARGLLKSKLVFEPWTVDAARARLAKIGMVSPDAAAG